MPLGAAVILVEQLPEIVLRGGIFYVTHEHGAVFAYRANTFFALVAAAASAGKQFKWDGGAEIIPFPAKGEAGH
jgi:hypothetical protein